MQKPRIEAYVVRPSDDEWVPSDAFGRKTGPGLEGKKRMPSEWREDSGAQELEPLESQSVGARKLKPRKAALIPANNVIAREVILAHDLSDAERRQSFFAAERYRLLCTRVLQVNRSLKSQVFLITSAIAGEGKTLTATNLAFGLSCVAGKRTLLVDLDLRRPSMHRLLGVCSKPGDCVFLEKDADWHESLLGLRANLDVLLALTSADKPDELLHSSGMTTFLKQAREEYDIVLIDSAPLLVAMDTHVLISFVDQALLVLRADSTPIDCAREAVGVLGAKALGCVLNDVKRLKYEEYYRSYYGDEKRA